MKKAIIVIFFAVFALSTPLKAQTVIVRPPAPMMIRPACPGPGFVWYNPYRRWNRRMNTYVWVNGYWGRGHGWHGGWRHGYRF